MFLSILLGLLPASSVMAHCEIPCVIYDDHARIKEIRENIDTIEKSIKKIKELSAQEEKNFNQIVRWVTNKETHANKIQEVVYQYFMAKRIKPVNFMNEEGI